MGKDKQTKKKDRSKPPPRGNIAENPSKGKWAGWGVGGLLVAIVGIVVRQVLSSELICTLTETAPEILDLADLKLASGETTWNDTMLWGSYRPQNYFGLRTREEQSFLIGLGWGVPGHMRSTAEDDNTINFGWQRHDGVRFGIQEIIDKKHQVTLETSFIKSSPTQWTARVKGHRSSTALPLLLAPTFSSEFSHIDVHETDTAVTLTSSTAKLGTFSVTLGGSWAVIKTRTQQGSEWDVKWDNIFRKKADETAEPNQVVLIRKMTSAEFTIEITMQNHGDRAASPPLAGCKYAVALSAYRNWFEARYTKVFGSSNEMGMHALSSLIGGIGYWYGTGLRNKGGIIPAQELFSAVPSRSKFPRGFLWDEGFHQLAISKWYPEIGKDVIASWLTQMEPSGWIPREQIRGTEPRSRVPMEFVPQNPNHANPPTLLLQIQNFALHDEHGENKAFLAKVWPYLRRWYSWWKRSQAGHKPYVFKWHGRSGYHLLSCGLDDYPRSKCDTPEESHVDLISWMTLMADTMESLAGFVEDSDARDFYRLERTELRKSLQETHWDADKNRFSDVSGCPPREDGSLPPKFVPFVGYVNLFPLLCGALDVVKDREQIIATVNLASEKLMSGRGLRSLSESSLKKVKKHDNYWTGPIWININYMFLRAMKEYRYEDIPEAAAVAEELRQDLVRTISAEYYRTGKLWENYNATDGRGRGTAPFTGWTALVMLMNP
eukprot:TRINITY_DN37212_c0_g1_i1.p1 TRINITY_DN37212_c0_g1~~TRINITY_DN37212_c0_g1_i1.p1  ORF type:complete len:719 (+),score=155.68 TRINITY_DN37212_c0_g1_i1:35-2191(+)